MKNKKLLYLFVSVTPLIIFPPIFNAFDLPKFIWIFFTTSIFILYFLISKKQYQIKRKHFFGPLVIFLIWGLFTGIKALNIFETLKTILVLFLFLNFYFFSSEIFEKEDIKNLLQFLIFTTIFVSIYGVLQVSGIDFINWEIKRSPLSTLGRRNFAGEYLVMIIPYVYFFIANSKNIREKIFYLFLFILFLLHLILTFTRASYLGFFVSTILFFYPVKFKFSLKKIIPLFVFFILIPNLFSYNISGFEKGTIKSRIFIWKNTLRIIKKNPIIGVGLGNFKTNFLFYAEDRPKQIALIKEVLEDVHNDFLEILVETGFIGFFIFLFLLFQIFKITFLLIKNSKEKTLIYGILCSTVAFLTNSLASFPFKKPSTLLLFYLNLSFLNIISKKEYYKLKISRTSILLYFLLFLISGTIISFRGFLGNYYYTKSKNAEKINPTYSTKMALISIKYNPFNYKTYFMVGNFYLKIEKLNDALFYFKKAEKLFPYIDSLQNNIGITYFKIGDFKEAEKHFLLSLKLNKYRSETYNNIGSLYIEMGKLNEAIYYLKKCIEIDPEFYLSYFNLGIAYLEKGEKLKAKEYFKKVIELKSDFQPAKEYIIK
ncbi:MAG: tetratricopeptide repeat protein [Candidatus Omnitrophica bacterium]|nr:tetratricopeptide repeat protein [Candidatus Omnitrophota bacterium]